VRQNLHSVLFGFSPKLAAHSARSSSNHSDGYAFSDDQANCFARLTENPESLGEMRARVNILNLILVQTDINGLPLASMGEIV
jgi:hypothetical protein